MWGLQVTWTPAPLCTPRFRSTLRNPPLSTAAAMAMASAASTIRAASSSTNSSTTATRSAYRDCAILSRRSMRSAARTSLSAFPTPICLAASPCSSHASGCYLNSIASASPLPPLPLRFPYPSPFRFMWRIRNRLLNAIGSSGGIQRGPHFRRAFLCVRKAIWKWWTALAAKQMSRKQCLSRLRRRWVNSVSSFIQRETVSDLFVDLISGKYLYMTLFVTTTVDDNRENMNICKFLIRFVYQICIRRCNWMIDLLKSVHSGSEWVC